MLAPAERKPDLRIVQIDRARASQGMTHRELCARAGLMYRHWIDLRHGELAPKDRTIARLRAALQQRWMATAPADLVRAALASASALLRLQTAVPIASGRLRRLAVYVVAVELQIENADVARALGMSRQNVQQVRNIVEDLRERDPATDALLEQCAALIKGE